MALLATAILVFTMVASTSSALAAPAAATVADADVMSALAPDGTFRGAAHLTGRVDTRAWVLTSDLAAGAPPRFAPATSGTAATIGWAALGSNGAGNGAINAIVLALAVSGTDLYVGGYFTNAGGIAAADYVAKWNGSTWSALGSNGAGNGALNDAVRAIAVSGSDVFVGGDFENAAGIATADIVARWNGSAWSALGSNGAGNGAIVGTYPGQNVSAMTMFGSDLIVGGGFNNAAGIATADHVARWNGSAWSALGSNGAGDGAIGDGCVQFMCWQPNIHAIAVSGTNLYIGGYFSNAGGLAAADDVAMWDGTSWSALGAKSDGEGAIDLDDANNQSYVVYALMPSGSDLYVGGNFPDAAGVAHTEAIAKWTGSAWTSVSGTRAPIDAVISMAYQGTDLYMAGGRNLAPEGAAGPPKAALVKWSGSAWSPVGGDDNGIIGGNTTGANVLVVNGDDIFVGGEIPNIASIATADHVARWGPGGVPFKPPVRKPDGRIKRGTGAYVGNNIYNTTGLNQSRTGSASRGHTITFTISIQNDGPVRERFWLKATGTPRSAYRVRYYHGSIDITAQVVYGVHRTALLAPGDRYVITAKVTVKSTAAAGSSVARLVTIWSANNPFKKDAVKFRGKRS